MTIGQVAQTIIVDNGSSEFCVSKMKIFSEQTGVRLILNNDNLGIATALNQGFRHAMSRGYKWVLTLDQDTVPSATLFEDLSTAYERCPFQNIVAIIGANYTEGTTGKELSFKRKSGNQDWEEVSEVITSGSMISLDAYEKVGPFRDKFFIDLVDFDYCLRLRMTGHKIIITPKIGITQSFGKYISKHFLFGRRNIRDYPPVRFYYRTRNGLLLVRENFRKEPFWAIKRLGWISIRPLSVILFEEDKLPKLKYIFLGILHALLSKEGKLVS